jgi:shikimate 5-dehydrogenase
LSITFTSDTLHPAATPTFYFIGVTTAASSIRSVFPLWAEALDLGEVSLVGIDLPLHAHRDQYRRVVEFIKGDPLSLGALVTTHKLDIFAAAADLFDQVDELAELMEEISSISKLGGLLRAHAKDPISSGLALDAFLPRGYFSEQLADVIIFGAGGSAIAIDWYLSHPSRREDRPTRSVVTNRSPARLDMLRRVHNASAPDRQLVTLVADTPNTNDHALAEAPPRSVVINATGLGKDAPGSPISDAAIFPTAAIAWDLNYRGELVFLDQARAASPRGVRAEDGWIYFVHGWTQVIAEVFHIDIPPSGPEFEELSRLASRTRR